MKDDYLWDKSGEADPEVEHLERVLGGLRSRRTAQDVMPAFQNLQRTRRRNVSMLLAIAATLAFAVLALGVFAFIQRQSQRQDTFGQPVSMVSPVPTEARSAQAEPAAGDTPQQAGAQPSPVEVSIMRPKRSGLETRRRAANRSLETTVHEREQAEGMLAKEQLIKALQITSSKLSFVQKKVKGTAAPLGPSS
jgi:cytoskeletal protein RodZ